MTTFGGSTIPPIFTGAGGIVTSVIADNSLGAGIITFGGFIFPVDPVADTGHYKVGRRDDSGDTTDFDQNWSGEPPVEPPFFVMEVTNQVGDFADVGSNGFTGANPACRSINNGDKDLSELAFVFSYYPTSKVAFKVEYTLFKEGSRAANENNDQLGLQAAVKF